MKRLALIAALLVWGFGAAAQTDGQYVPEPVKVTTDMVRNGDHLFYAHVVVARQTLYSIAKAYGVSTLDIIDANPKLDLRNRPIHPGDVLLIPVRQIPDQVGDDRGDTVGDDTTVIPGGDRKSFSGDGNRVKDRGELALVGSAVLRGLLGLAELGGGYELHRRSNLEGTSDGSDAGLGFLERCH